MIFHPDYALPLRACVENVILQSDDRIAFFFDFGALKSASGFFKDIPMLPQPTADPTNDAQTRVLPLPNTSAKALHLIRRLIGSPWRRNKRIILKQVDYEDPELGDTIIQILDFSGVFHCPYLRRKLVRSLRKEPFLQFAFQLHPQPPARARCLSRMLVRKHRFADMPVPARTVLTRLYPEALGLLERLYETRERETDFSLEDIKRMISNVKIQAAGARGCCSIHEQPLSATQYKDLRPALVKKLQLKHLETETSLKKVIWLTLGCKSESCATPFIRALKKINLPMPETIGDLRILERKNARAEERS